MDALNRILYRMAKGLVIVLGRLPKSCRDSSAIVLGSLLYRVAVRHRKIVIENLTKAFGRSKSKSTIHTIACNVFISLWRNFFELGWSLNQPLDQLSDHITISGLSVYERALAKGRGVLLLGAHFGNWELLAMVGHMAQMTWKVVYRPLDAPFLDKLVREARSRYGVEPIPTHKGAMRKIYWTLRQGHCVGLLLDQSADWYDGVFVDFFGRGTFTNSGMALLALKSGAPVVPLFLVREANGFHAIFGPELPLIKTGDHTKDIEANTQQYNWLIEAYARMYPEQWFWVHRRWKNPPAWPWPRVLDMKKKKKRT
jgi:KDO2-lipid IV(A) lauroyltransferase